MKSQGITSLNTSHPEVDIPNFVEIHVVVVEKFKLNLMVVLEEKSGDHQRH